MKRSLFLAAVAMMACGSALAQSAPTVWGRINLTLEREKLSDQSATRKMNNNSSRLGFKGSEDLGDGLSALYHLEFGVTPDVAAPQMTSRQTFVGLTGRFGTLRGGRMFSGAYYAVADYISMHNHDTGTSADMLYDYTSDNNNKIAYTTPTFSGFNVEVQRSLRESNPDQANTNDVAVNYVGGPLHLGAGYVKRLGGEHQYAVRALYQFGPFALGGYYQRTDGDFTDGTSAERNAVRLAGMYTVGASEFHVNVGKAGERGDVANSGAVQWTLGYNYNLSKRTKVYGYYTRVNNDSAGAYMTGVAGVDYASLAAGIRHNF